LEVKNCFFQVQPLELGNLPGFNLVIARLGQGKNCWVLFPERSTLDVEELFGFTIGGFPFFHFKTQWGFFGTLPRRKKLGLNPQLLKKRPQSSRAFKGTFVKPAKELA